MGVKTSADARTIRSRDAMRAALLGLLEQTPLERISIRDIAKAASVGHATFYRHYATREELLEDLAAEEVQRLVNLSLPVMDAVNSGAACAALCEYVQTHRALWGVLLTGGAAGAMKVELLRISTELAVDRAPRENQLPADLRVILTVSSIVELLAWWLRQEAPMEAAEVAKILDRVIVSRTVQQMLNSYDLEG